MTVIGPILVLVVAAEVALAWIMGGSLAVWGVLVGLLISVVPCWIPYQAVRRGEEHGKAVLQATGVRFVSALVVVAIAELSQPKEIAKTFLLGMAASYLVMLAAETFYFSRTSDDRSGPATPAAS